VTYGTTPCNVLREAVAIGELVGELIPTGQAKGVLKGLGPLDHKQTFKQQICKRPSELAFELERAQSDFRFITTQSGVYLPIFAFLV
jgi:hypothetical protein